jgi:hypothetical protein
MISLDTSNEPMFSELKLERGKFGRLRVSHSSHSSAKSIAPNLIQSYSVDVFLNAITSRYREISPSYGNDKLLDPAVLLTLPDEVRYGANLFGFQKVYEGTWAVDIFFEPSNSKSQLDSESLPNLKCLFSEADYSTRLALHRQISLNSTTSSLEFVQISFCCSFPTNLHLLCLATIFR